MEKVLDARKIKVIAGEIGSESGAKIESIYLARRWDENKRKISDELVYKALSQTDDQLNTATTSNR